MLTNRNGIYQQVHIIAEIRERNNLISLYYQQFHILFAEMLIRTYSFQLCLEHPRLK